MKDITHECNQCRKIKPVRDFYADKSLRRGHSNKCKTCVKDNYMLIKRELTPTRSFPICKTPCGNLKEITDIELRFRYFVSDIGHVYKKLENNKYQKLTEYLINGNPTVSLTLKIKGKGAKMAMISRLILQYFIGGYYPLRGIKYIDGDKTNCTIKNIRWRIGLGRKQTINEARLIDLKRIHKFDKNAAKYIISKDMRFLYSAINVHEGLVYVILKDRGYLSHFQEVMHSIVDRIKIRIDNGAYYIPNSMEYVSYGLVRYSVLSYIKSENRKNGREVSYSSIGHNGDTIMNSKRKVTESVQEQEMSISEEIESMFNDLSY